MIDQFRHIILLLILSALAASCETQEQEPVAAPTPGCAMEFDVEPLSRASLTTAKNLYAAPFAVYSDWSKTEDIFHNGFFGERVAYDASTGSWKHENTQYWWPDFEHSFVAVHPHEAANTIRELKYAENTLSMIVIMPSNYTDAVDILTATHRRNYIDGNSSPVVFKFDHILSNFNIRVSYTNPAEDAAPLFVNSISFEDVPTQATYRLTPAPLTGSSTMTSDYVLDPDSYDGWLNQRNGTVSLTFREARDSKRTIPADGKPHDLFSADDALLMIPNPDAPTDMIITYTTADSAGEHQKSERLSIPQGWHAGMSYTLSLSITEGKIEFSISVAEWEETDPINTIVPRK